MSESPLLSLPGEIRNEIYSLLLVASFQPREPRSIMLEPEPLYPQILSVCRQTNREACRLLYEKNTFIVHYSLLSGLPQLHRWSKPVTSAHLIAMIKRYHVYVRLDCDAHFTATAAKQAFTGVELLTIQNFQTQFGSSSFDVLRRFEEIRGVKKARVTGSVLGFPGYVSWLERAMMSPEGARVEDFDEEMVDREGKYDLWTHGGR